MNKLTTSVRLIIILAVLITGWIFLWQYFTSETKTSDDSIEINVYFSNTDLYNELQQELCPNNECPQEMRDTYGADECSPIFPVKRIISNADDSGELIRFLIAELKNGPTQEETGRGFIEKRNSFIEMLREDYEIRGGVLILELDEDKFREWEEEISPRSLSSLSSCEWSSSLFLIYRTFEQIKGVEKVEIDFCSVDPEFCPGNYLRNERWFNYSRRAQSVF
jgi:hypothetical protein